MKTQIMSLLILASFGCKDDESPTGSEPSRFDEWLIDRASVFDGGPGKDGIPAIDEPNFELTSSAVHDYLTEDDLVLGIKMGDDVRAYPHDILDWHEIVNDAVDDQSVAITYCPLTGTGIGWERSVAGNVTTFGVSGLLFNSNLIAYDRATDSNWSQMKSLSVNGPNIATNAAQFQIIETTWGTWKRYYPESNVLTTNTGYSRSYGNYPYRNYKESERLIFPIDHEDNRLHAKERVLGVKLDEEIKVYPISTFDGGKIIIDDQSGSNLVVIGNLEENWITVFENPSLNGQSLELVLVNNPPAIVKDQFGNEWDMFGKAITGSDAGSVLKVPRSFVGYWFAWATFYPDLVLYEQD
ncbi:MAG: DUF3179 domain-containing protein [Cyclobacteriaceae bacterium]